MEKTKKQIIDGIEENKGFGLEDVQGFFKGTIWNEERPDNLPPASSEWEGQSYLIEGIHYVCKKNESNVYEWIGYDNAGKELVYTDLADKPKINGQVINGNLSSETIGVADHPSRLVEVTPSDSLKLMSYDKEESKGSVITIRALGEYLEKRRPTNAGQTLISGNFHAESGRIDVLYFFIEDWPICPETSKGLFFSVNEPSSGVFRNDIKFVPDPDDLFVYQAKDLDNNNVGGIEVSVLIRVGVWAADGVLKVETRDEKIGWWEDQFGGWVSGSGWIWKELSPNNFIYYDTNENELHISGQFAVLFINGYNIPIKKSYRQLGKVVIPMANPFLYGKEYDVKIKQY